MATHSNYAPWILGYSERKTIAPGLFEFNKEKMNITKFEDECFESFNEKVWKVEC